MNTRGNQLKKLIPKSTGEPWSKAADDNFIKMCMESTAPFRKNATEDEKADALYEPKQYPPESEAKPIDMKKACEELHIKWNPAFAR